MELLSILQRYITPLFYSSMQLSSPRCSIRHCKPCSTAARNALARCIAIAIPVNSHNPRFIPAAIAPALAVSTMIIRDGCCGSS